MKKNLKIALNILVFLIYYFMPKLFNFILKVLNINYSNFPTLTIIILFLTELIPLIFLLLIYKKDFKEEFENYKNNFFDKIDKYIWIYIFGLVIMTISNSLITAITGSDMPSNEKAIRAITNVLPIYMFISASITGPITEELVYRKCISNIFTNKYLAIVMSGIIFGLAHILGSYKEISDLLYVIPYGTFGAVFMYIYLDSKSIFSTITIHIVHNTLLMIMFFVR